MVDITMLGRQTGYDEMEFTAEHEYLNITIDTLDGSFGLFR